VRDDGDITEVGSFDLHLLLVIRISGPSLMVCRPWSIV
jgi:hypothetical protein